MWRRNKKPRDDTPDKDAIATAIAECIVKACAFIAQNLNRAERRYSTMQKKMLLILFCFLLSGYYIHLAITVLHKRPKEWFTRQTGSSIPPIDSIALKKRTLKNKRQ